MFIKKVILKDFRNYEEASVEFQPGVNIIEGKNAQGKTNLLESISIMSMGKSFRTRKDSEMIRFGRERALAICEFHREGRDGKVEIEITKEGKKLRVDGCPVEKHIDFLENLYFVVFSPDDLKIVKEDPEKRRKFMDRELCQLKPVYYKNLSRYRKILKQRNMLLKERGIKRDILAPWDDLLAESGSYLAAERRDFVSKISPISKKIHAGITENREQLFLSYEGDLASGESRKEMREMFSTILKNNVEKDIYNGNTSAGPHKDDIRIDVDDIDVRKFGSQGQQRTAALSLKLAELDLIQEETGEKGILLLDDVLSELDEKRQHYLISFLKGAQLFITAAGWNDRLLSDLPEHSVFIVEEGNIRENRANLHKKIDNTYV